MNVPELLQLVCTLTLVLEDPSDVAVHLFLILLTNTGMKLGGLQLHCSKGCNHILAVQSTYVEKIFTVHSIAKCQ
jgi:hypothetical protein